MPKDKANVQDRTAENTTLAELFETVAPPRDGTTGVHLVAVGDAYAMIIQGPEALHVTRRILDFTNALHEEVEKKHEQQAEKSAIIIP